MLQTETHIYVAVSYPICDATYSHNTVTTFMFNTIVTITSLVVTKSSNDLHRHNIVTKQLRN